MRIVKLNCVNNFLNFEGITFRTKGANEGITALHPHPFQKVKGQVTITYPDCTIERLNKGDEINANLNQNDGFMSRVIFEGIEGNDATFRVGPRVEVE